jgi:hypothetical protein
MWKNCEGRDDDYPQLLRLAHRVSRKCSSEKHETCLETMST